MSKIHFLQVKHGDSFVIECDKGGNHGVIVVDGGPRGCGKVLKAKIEELGVIPDLMVLTHYDDDHIGGLTEYTDLCSKEEHEPAKEVWANCRGWVVKEESKPVDENGRIRPVPKSIPQAITMGKQMLGLVNKYGFVWNDAVSEGYVREDFPFASIEVVSPTRDVMGMIINKQEDAVRKEEEKKAKDALKMKAAIDIRFDEDYNTPLDELVGHTPKPAKLTEDNELANAASIAFILRCDDLSVLMLGDCYPQNVEAYLRSKGYSEKNPLVVDYVKVAHHGSDNNTSNGLLDIIKCNHYIISTNGGKTTFTHPDRVCIAHILCHPMRDREETVHLYFDYPMRTIETVGNVFLRKGEEEEWNFVIHDDVSLLEPLEGKKGLPEGVIGKDILDQLTEDAKNSERLRMNYDLRNSEEDQSQRMLNAIEPGTVMPIHRHKNTSETVVCLRGHFKEFFYDGEGNLTDTIDMLPGGYLINIPAGQWHTLKSLESGTVLLECKDGPYEPMAEDDILKV